MTQSVGNFFCMREHAGSASGENTRGRVSDDTPQLVLAPANPVRSFVGMVRVGKAVSNLVGTQIDHLFVRLKLNLDCF